MPFKFDPDALLSALPRREVRAFGSKIVFKSRKPHAAPNQSMLFEAGAYNGFSHRERYRTADLSNSLVNAGCTKRPASCDICNGLAHDEHAENYYDLTSWVGLCQRCHRSALHGRFQRSKKWFELLDAYELPTEHWARLVAREPFDLAAMLRQRGWREPIKADYAPACR